MSAKNSIKVFYLNDTEDYVSNDVMEQMYDVELYAFVADDGRGNLSLAFGPTLDEGKLVPLVSSSPIEINDTITAMAAAASAMRGTPLYLVKLVISDVVNRIEGRNITDFIPND